MPKGPVIRSQEKRRRGERRLFLLAMDGEGTSTRRVSATGEGGEKGLPLASFRIRRGRGTPSTPSTRFGEEEGDTGRESIPTRRSAWGEKKLGAALRRQEVRKRGGGGEGKGGAHWKEGDKHACLIFPLLSRGGASLHVEARRSPSHQEEGRKGRGRRGGRW